MTDRDISIIISKGAYTHAHTSLIHTTYIYTHTKLIIYICIQIIELNRIKLLLKCANSRTICERVKHFRESITIIYKVIKIICF